MSDGCRNPAGSGLDVLAISFMLPPQTMPQAIQIGRLLRHSRHRIAALCGASAGASVATEQAGTYRHCLCVPHDGPRRDAGHRFARRFLPLHGRVPDEFRSWIPRAQAAAGQLLNRGDYRPAVMVSFGEPMSDHLVALRLKRTFGLPWIAHFSDPWAANPFRRREVIANIVNRRLERDVIAAADAVIVTSRETLALLCRTHGARLAAKSHVLPHSFEPSLYPIDAPREKGIIIARYVGGFYGHRTPLPLLYAIERLQRDDAQALRGVRFEMVGGMPAWMRLYPAIRRADSKLVRWLGTVGYGLSLELMSSADLLLVIDAPAEESVFLPSKLVDYLGADAPILGIVPPGAAQRLIEAAGGMTTDPSDVAAVAKALRAMLERVRAAGPGAAPDAGRLAARAAHEASIVADRFDGIVAAVAKASAGNGACGPRGAP